MSIEIYPDTKVYVAAPANFATGGPELLHQLVYHLRMDLSIKAYMYYIPNNHPSPVHVAYRFYNNPFVREVEDNKNNILVVPEIKMGIELLNNFREVRKIIWWLSVDNLYLSYILDFRKNFFIQRALNKISRKIYGKDLFDVLELALSNKRREEFWFPEIIYIADFHFVQSHYALKYLADHGIPNNKIFYLSDYLNQSFLQIKTDLSEKENIVAYNPKKGWAFTKKIISSAKDIKFVPLINMSREEIIQILRKAKVYIDFGNHPGKDRLPREAAILMCCVITGKRGSAKFFEDVPTPEEYKFEDKEENIPKIVEKIKDCFNNFEERYKDFDYYRQVIKNEPQKFLGDFKKIFIKL